HSRNVFRDIFDEICAKLSHAAAQCHERLSTMNERALVWVMVGAYVVLIAALAGASTLPSLRNPLVELNEVVRGFIGGWLSRLDSEFTVRTIVLRLEFDRSVMSPDAGGSKRS